MLALNQQSGAGALSVIFSTCSISCWLVALLPQEYKTYKDKSVHAISPYWLLFLFFGDFLNFLGCILTHQLPFQLYNSCYALCNDCVMFFQYWYYGSYLKNQRKIVSEEEDLEVSQTDSYGTMSMSTNSLATSILLATHFEGTSAYSLTTAQSVTELSVGRLIAFGCAFCYIVSRVPQLYKNYTRKTTQGVSPVFITIVIFANSFYAASILTSNQFLHGSDKLAFFYNELPYLLGNVGSILLDFVFFYQYYSYSDHLQLVLDDMVQVQ